MALKGAAITVCYQAWNTSTNAGQTGDSANHTLKLVQDGTEASPTNSPTQVDATNLPGLYKLVLATADTNFNCIVLGGISSTANVVIIPLVIITEQGVLPTTACTTRTNSLLTSGTGTDQLAVAAGKVLLQATQTGVTIPTVTTVTNQLTAAQIATGVWQDTTSGDFTVASSIGKGLFVSGAAPGASGGFQINGANAGSVSYTSGITANITGNLSGSVGSVTGAVGSVTGNVGGNVAGSVGSISGVAFPSHFSSLAIDVSGNVTFNNTTIATTTNVTSAVTVNFSETLGTPRALDAIADGSMTFNDALWAAVCGAAGKESITGTSYVIQTPSTGTTIRTFTLNSSTTPTSRS